MVSKRPIRSSKHPIGSEHKLTIEKVVYQGWGLGFSDGKAIFVPHTLPGDEVDVTISRYQKRFCMGKVTHFHQSSTYRSESLCQHFPTCGGCQFMDVDYAKQCEIKQLVFHDSIRQFYPEIIEKVAPIIPSQVSTYYRNKMEFAFGSKEDSNGNAQLTLGLKKRGTFDQVVGLSDCLLMSPVANQIIAFTVSFFQKAGLTAWDTHTHQGDLRHLMVRHAKGPNHYMVNLIASQDNSDLFLDYAQSLQAQFPQIVSLYKAIHEGPGEHTLAPPILILGEEAIYEQLGDFNFKISPLSFFQTNSKQAEVLYEEIRRVLDPQKNELLMDLYCGTGTIGMTLAPYVDSVIGIEENPSAIRDALENTQKNGCHNMTFHEGRVKNILKFNSFGPDAVVVDPPRAGMVPKALRRMAELQAKKLVYVSCNPTTLLRDLRDLSEHGYQVDTLVPVDMFPGTYHIEVVTRLSLRS